MVGEAADALFDAVPVDVLALLLEAQVHHGFILAEDAAGQIGGGFGGEVDVEHALCPSLCGPSLALAQIVDGSPVGQADDL